MNQPIPKSVWADMEKTNVYKMVSQYLWQLSFSGEHLAGPE